ncbi:MAG: DM13 domain-containing protein, partial [Candidatus Dadabacteria bacterium]|nr:DM13 domain-containing protein [Candidatus Dadabacteria bacterium]
MKKVLVIGGIIVIVVAWYLFRPEKLFIDESVNEGFPSHYSEQSDDPPKVVSQGEFHGVAHETSGTASIFRLRGGSYVLRLTDFETSNGPDVRVYLGQAEDANNNDTVTNAG